MSQQFGFEYLMCAFGAGLGLGPVLWHMLGALGRKLDYLWPEPDAQVPFWYVSRAPKEVLAQRFAGGKPCQGVWGWEPGAHTCVACIPNEPPYDVNGPAVVTMQHQVVPIAPGDWVLQEHNDKYHYYPVADQEFRRLYRRA